MNGLGFMALGFLVLLAGASALATWVKNLIDRKERIAFAAGVESLQTLYDMWPATETVYAALRTQVLASCSALIARFEKGSGDDPAPAMADLIYNLMDFRNRISEVPPSLGKVRNWVDASIRTSEQVRVNLAIVKVDALLQLLDRYREWLETQHIVDLSTLRLEYNKCALGINAELERFFSQVPAKEGWLGDPRGENVRLSSVSITS